MTSDTKRKKRSAFSALVPRNQASTQRVPTVSPSVRTVSADDAVNVKFNSASALDRSSGESSFIPVPSVKPSGNVLPGSVDKVQRPDKMPGNSLSPGANRPAYPTASLQQLAVIAGPLLHDHRFGSERRSSIVRRARATGQQVRGRASRVESGSR